MHKYILFLCAISFPLLARAADIAAGKTIFEQRCVACHGAEGKGDGAAAAAFPPEMKPRDLAHGPFKVVGTDDAKLKDVITKGGAAMGLSPLMAPQTGLSPSDLDNLVAFVRSLKK